MKSSSKAAVEIIHFADPWCTWSWSLEPILSRLKEVYGGQLKITYKMGGVTDNFHEWRHHYDAVTDEKLNKWFAETLELGKMPFVIDYVLKSKTSTTYPACIAFKAAQMQGEKLAHKFLRRLMETSMIECKNSSNEAVYLKVAKEVGLDVGKMKKDAKSGKAKELFLKDKSEMNVNFLSLIIVDLKTKKEVVGGEIFTSAHPYEHAIDNLTMKKLKKSTPTDIPEYFKDHENEHIPAHEIAIVFDLIEKQAVKSLSDLTKNGFVEKKHFDFADFWTYQK